jgi:hypothetical protein
MTSFFGMAPTNPGTSRLVFRRRIHSAPQISQADGPPQPPTNGAYLDVSASAANHRQPENMRQICTLTLRPRARTHKLTSMAQRPMP